MHKTPLLASQSSILERHLKTATLASRVWHNTRAFSFSRSRKTSLSLLTAASADRCAPCTDWYEKIASSPGQGISKGVQSEGIRFDFNNIGDAQRHSIEPTVSHPSFVWNSSFSTLLVLAGIFTSPILPSGVLYDH